MDSNIEELDDLDVLVGLLDDENGETDSDQMQTLKTSSSIIKSKNELYKSANSPDHLEKNETFNATSTNAIKQNAILKAHSSLKDNGLGMQDSSFQAKLSSGDLDPLEVELLAMENRMMSLRKKLRDKKDAQNKETNSQPVISPGNGKSEVHAGDTDSEDDENNRNPFEPSLTSSGQDMKKRLAHTPYKRKEIFDSKFNNIGSNLTTWNKTANSLLPAGTSKTIDPNCTKDPFSGIRIMNPLVTANAMNEMMDGRKMIEMSSLFKHVRGGEIDGDWVSIGVLVSKTDTKKSQKGNQYCIWQLSDLKDCTKIISLFLFASAYKNLWKTSVGSVVGILNAQVMKDKEDCKRDSLTLSINSHQKVLLMGSSKDLSWCQGRTKQGSRCRQFVNKNVCEFCVFHIQREYQKTCSKRSEIQSSFSRVDPRKALQKKIFGKDQIIYGGQLFTPGKEVITTGKKLKPANNAKDLATLSSLSTLKMKLKSEELKEIDKKNSFVLNHMSDKQISAVKEVVKENEGMGQLLLAPTPGARNLLKHLSNDQEAIKKDPGDTIKELSAKELLKKTAEERKKYNQVPVKSPFGSLSLNRAPVLGRDLKPNSEVDLNSVSPRNHSKEAKKLRAAMILKDKGGIRPTQKNFQRNKEKAQDNAFQESVKKRLRETNPSKDIEEERSAKFTKKVENDISSLSNNASKKPLLGKIDLNSEKFKKMIEAKSKHKNLIQDVEDAEMEKYYNSLEKKEMLENKITSVMEVPTKAVICLKCKYTSFSASDKCREEQHPLKVIQATKRFFECRNCKQRTVSLDRLPTHPCSHCDSSSWVRAAMGKERKGPKLESEVLSLRGNELNSYGSASGQIFLNL